MNPHALFCPNTECPARWQTGKGNIHVHSLKEKRCRCDICGQTFATNQGMIFYRLRTSPQIVMWVMLLLAYGCPIQAIVKAFLFDKRTVGVDPFSWLFRKNRAASLRMKKTQAE